MDAARITDDAAAVRADLKAVIDSLVSKTPLDPAVVRRVRERSDRMTEELRRAHGEMNVAVDLIREIRDDE